MIRNDPNYPQLCDDEKLIAVLSNGDEAADHQEIVEHIEQCSRCQQRFDELAAGTQDWTKVRQALLNDDPYSENAAGSAKWNFSLRNEGPIAWTESMASQLLSPPSHPELLGRIGRYDVERLIGSGGMGVVFKAHDTELNRPVAIKILAPYLSGSGPARQRFSREARAAAAVVHEHVVPIYNVETERETPFLVMHYVAGESLQGRIDREGALDLCEILRIGMQVASGLSAAHQQGLVHRDIKPSNILMEQGVERALITDFGLARAADDASLTRTGFHPGTPQYMSPEQASGEQVDSRSDLFSFGSVLYTMCTGRPPFRAETSLGVLRRITDVEPRPIREISPNIPEWLCNLIQKLMAKSPEDRFGSAKEVAELLADCLAHVQQPTSTPLPGALLAPANSAKRRGRPPRFKWFTGAAFAFAMLLAGVLIVLELNKGTLTIECEANDVPIRIMRGDEVVKQMTVTKSGESLRVAAGEYVVEVDGTFDGIAIINGVVSLKRGQTETAKITLSDHNTTTPKAPVISSSQSTVVFYNASDLLDYSAPESIAVQLEQLRELVLTTIEPDSWQKINTTVSIVPENRGLLVRQTSARHKMIAELFNQLQKMLEAHKNPDEFQTLLQSLRIVANADPGKSCAATGPPEPIEILNRIEAQKGLEPNSITSLYESHKDRFRIVVEPVLDKLVPAREYPLIGKVVLHLLNYRCTVHFSKSEELNWPLAAEGADVQEVTIYIDSAHLHRDDDKMQSAVRASPGAGAFHDDGGASNVRDDGNHTPEKHPETGMAGMHPQNSAPFQRDEQTVGNNVNVLLSVAEYSKEVMEKNLQNKELSLYAAGVKARTEKSDAETLATIVLAHDCGYSSFTEEELNGEKYWNASFFIPQQRSNTTLNIDVTQQSLDQMWFQGARFQLDHYIGQQPSKGSPEKSNPSDAGAAQ